jgi:hypothetical protein
MSARIIAPAQQTVAWMLRIAASQEMSLYLALDPVAFAGWYAMVTDALSWPDDVQRIQQAARSRTLSLERTLKLLAQVDFTFSGRTSAEHARRVLEGYDVHRWVQLNRDAFTALAKSALERAILAARLAPEDDTPLQAFAGRIGALGRVLGLSDLERSILTFAFLCGASEELRGVFERLASNRWVAERLWTTIFETSRERLAAAVGPRSKLRLSGLLETTGRNAQLVAVSQFWIELVASDELEAAILEPLPEKAEPGMPARLSDEDMALAVSILKNAREPGVNLLLYGPAALEKRRLTHAIARQAGRKLWRVRRMEDAHHRDLATLTYVAQRVLANHDPAGVLVIEHPADVLRTQPSELLRALFGIEVTGEGMPAFDEHLLASNPVPTVWLSASVGSLADEAVTRFVFHAAAMKADRQERMNVLQQRMQGLRLSKRAAEDILKLEGVSTAQLEAAVRAARLSGVRTKRERDAAIVQAVRRSQRALGRDLQAKMKPSVTEYSLKYLNTVGRFGPTEILACLKKNPRGSIVLYGPPGTGKTQFVEYMAAELSMPLVAKRASDLLSKWVGESEKNIAAAFEAAAVEEAILLLDEGDSFLRDRTMARASWEVTQVNELLQQIERFDGIVVVCTNLFRGLDAAALRRFTFKVEFRQLDADQRWEMFVNEAGLRTRLPEIPSATRDAWFERLALMPQLTPGDFATVKRQCILLGTQLSPEEWLTQLQLECDVKARPVHDREME